MSKKEIKNNYAESPFGDPAQYQWGKNIWGTKFPIIGAIVIGITLVIVIWADSKGMIDWQKSEDPFQNQHPLQQPKIDNDTLKMK